MRFLLWLFAVVGVLALVCVVALVGFGVVSFNKGVKTVRDGQAFVDETIVLYGENWDGAVLLDRGAPEFLSEVAKTPGALDLLQSFLTQQAGDFVSAQPAACDNFGFSKGAEKETVFTASCIASGEVEKGSAVYTVNIIQRNEQWQLLGFFVNVVQDTVRPDTSVQVSYGSSAMYPSRDMRFDIANHTYQLSTAPLQVSASTLGGVDAAVGMTVSAMVPAHAVAAPMDAAPLEFRP